MSITGEQLRFARRMANLTQSELAEKLNVSKRTVVNWEREDGGVPGKSTEQVASVLGLEETLSGEWRPKGMAHFSTQARTEENEGLGKVDFVPSAASSGDEPWIEFVFQSPNDDTPETKAAVGQVLEALKVADRASRYSIEPVYIMQLLESLTNIVMSTGLAHSRGIHDDRSDLLGYVVGESKRIMSVVISNYPDYLEFQESANFTSARVSFDNYEKSLDQIRRQRAENVGGAGDDSHPDVYSDSQHQDGYGLAAKKRSEDRGEVTYD